MAIKYKHKGFTLLEVMLASVLFSATMIGAIAIISSGLTTIRRAQNIKEVNSALRGLNQELSGAVMRAGCLTASQSDDAVLLWDERCAELKLTYGIKDGRLYRQGTGEEPEYLLSDGVFFAKRGEAPIFSVANNNLLTVELKAEAKNKLTTSVEYRVSLATREWQ